MIKKTYFSIRGLFEVKYKLKGIIYGYKIKDHGNSTFKLLLKKKDLIMFP